MDPNLKERIIKTLVNQIRSSSVRSGDVDWYIGFKPTAQTPFEETERDPRTGKIVNNTEIGDRATYLQHWGHGGKGFLEGDEERDSGTYAARMWNTLLEPYE